MLFDFTISKYITFDHNNCFLIIIGCVGISYLGVHLPYKLTSRGGHHHKLIDVNLCHKSSVYMLHVVLLEIQIPSPWIFLGLLVSEFHVEGSLGKS